VALGTCTFLFNVSTIIMQDYQNPPNKDLFSSQQTLPNSTTVLVLGILSIVVCFICGIIALIMSSGDKRLYEQNPGLYTTSSYDMLKAGRICAIVSLCLWGIGIVIYVGIIAFAIGIGGWH
jgi:hypothetical protein